MPQIANQDYNFIDFNVLPLYEGLERLYRAYLQGTAFDCVARDGEKTEKIISYEEQTIRDVVFVTLKIFENVKRYILKAPLTTDESGFLIFKVEEPIYIVSADGFKLKPVVNDGVLTGVEETTEKVENNQPAQYFKEWMIGQPVEGGIK